MGKDINILLDDEHADAQKMILLRLCCSSNTDHISHVIGKETSKAYAKRKGSGEPALPHSLARTCPVRSR